MNSLWMALAMVVMCGLAAPAGALAAAPANDDFGNRAVLGPGFPGGTPVVVEASNAGAEKEEGEFISPFAAGHSVWYEWEATSTGWVTIGACEAEFPTIVGVYTGTEIDKLTPVASGNGDEGPGCFNQRQYTFKAKSGTKYVIAVDGNGFFVEPPPPVTEGDFTLRIEATPPPPNDDFANATLLEGKVGEEPGGNRFYFANAQGYNWGATTALGEPEYAVGAGASVWYTWTAPESAKYRFGSPCCGAGLSRSVYAGDAVDELTPFLTGSESAEAQVSAGTTLKIVVYGTPDAETEEPSMASFGFNISAELPPLPPGPSPGSGGGPTPQPDMEAPQTTLVKSRLQAATRSATFWFSASEAGGFLCRLDGKPFKPCTSPKSYRHLMPGRHTFRVKALDAAGNADASPVVAHFRLPSQSRRRGR
jgi:hypothetical protein